MIADKIVIVLPEYYENITESYQANDDEKIISEKVTRKDFIF